LSLIILTIIVTLAKQNYKTPWRWYGCIETSWSNNII